MNPDVLALTWRAGAWEDQGQGQRVAVVRRAFFDEGRVPSGLVADVVLDSWRRCLEAGMRPGARPVLEPVSRTRTNYVTGRDHVLLKAARGPFDELQASLARSRCKAMLIDRAGVLLRTTPPRDDDSPLLRAVARPGVDLGELLVGTNAPSLAVRTGASCVVGPGEHYYDVFGGVCCVAAPIYNRCGTRVAVLDLTIEHQPFGFDAVWLVSAYASAIESNFRIAQTRRQVLVRLHPSPAMLDGAAAGLVAIDERGRISWLNQVAAALMGLRDSASGARHCEQALGIGLRQVLELTAARCPWVLPLPSGLTVWASAVYREQGNGAPDGDDVSEDPPAADATEHPASEPGAVAAESCGSLAQLNRQFIERSLNLCGGNVSRAARMLGVSRGLLYRRLRERPDRAI